MNVLILTPGRTASSLLQRLITISMLQNNYDKRIVNIHDLLYGLDENLKFLSDPDHQNFSQSLNDIIKILENNDCYKVGRIAFKGFQKRNDAETEREKLYDYINDNFYIIRSLRNNILEFALSWIIVKYTKKRNMYSVSERDEIFSLLRQKKIKVEKEELTSLFDLYQDYIQWSDKNFNIQSEYVYNNSIKSLEPFVQSLPFTSDKSWEELFGISFENWNECHNGLSNENLDLYKRVHDLISSYVQQNILPSHLSIKLNHKLLLIENFSDCLMWYNNWLSNSHSKVYM